MAIKRQKIQIDVEATTEGAVRGMDRVAKATDGARKAVEKDNDALKKASLEYQVAQARAQNFADAQAKLTKKMEEFGKASERGRARLKEAQQNYEAQDKLIAKVGKRLQVDLVGGLMAVSSAINIGQTAWGMFTAGIDKVSELAARATSLNNVMGNLPFSLDKARQATGGLVKDMDLATAASTLVSTGVVKNADQFAELARAAQALGGRIGIDAKQAMDSLTASLARGSTEMLDNLGIVLKQEQAERIYAQSLGKSAKALTDDEKAQAFREVAMRKIIEAARGIKVDTDSAGAAVQRFEADLDRLENKALGGAESQVSLKKGLAQVALEFRATSSDMAAHGVEGDKLRGMLKDLNVNTDDLTISNEKLGKELDKVRKEELGRVERLIFQGEATEENIRQLEFLRRALGDAGMVGATAVDAAIERQKEEALAARQARQALEQEHTDLKLSIAFLQGKGEDQKLLNAAVMEEMELRAKLLEGEGKSAEAARLRADIELAKARMDGEALRKRSGGGRRKEKKSEAEHQRELARIAFESRQSEWARMDALNKARFERAQENNPFSDKNIELQLDNVIDFEERRAQIEAARGARDAERRAAELAAIEDFYTSAERAEMESMNRRARMEFRREKRASRKASGAEAFRTAFGFVGSTDEAIAAVQREANARLEALAAEEAALERQFQRDIARAVLADDQHAAAEARARREIELAEMRNEAESIHHTVSMARITEQQTAEQAAHARRSEILTESSELFIGAASSVAQAVLMEGKSLKDSVASTAKAEALRHTILGGGELIRAAISAASYDFPAAAAHVKNAGMSFAFAAAMGGIAGAAGAFGPTRTVTAPGFGADAFGAGPGGLGGSAGAGPGGGGQSSNMGGPVPLSVETKQKVSGSAWSSGAANSGPSTVNNNTFYVTGAIDEQTAMKMSLAQERAKQRQGKISAGGFGFG